MNTIVLFESFLETTPSDSIYFLNIVFEIELSSRRELQVIITERYFEQVSLFRESNRPSREVSEEIIRALVPRGQGIPRTLRDPLNNYGRNYVSFSRFLSIVDEMVRRRFDRTRITERGNG